MNPLKPIILALAITPLLAFAAHSRNPAKAIGFYEKRCEGGYAQACSDLAVGYESGPMKDLSKVRIYFQKACNLGDNYSCREAAKLK